MHITHGKAVNQGIAIGPIVCFLPEQLDVTSEKISEAQVNDELERYLEARKQSIAQLESLSQKALHEIGKEGALVFEAHAMMVNDINFIESVEQIIRDQKYRAELAVKIVGDQHVTLFSEMEDEYFKARSADIRDIVDRLIRNLTGVRSVFQLTEPSIVAAKELMPSHTIQIDRNKLLGIVTYQGSENSHTAILARTMNIPALIGIELNADRNGQEAIIDGFEEKLILNPDHETLNLYIEKQNKQTTEWAKLQNYIGKEDISPNGHRVKLYANIGEPQDVKLVLDNDAKGIGLFRSEFLFLNRDTYPNEEIQFQAYREVVTKMKGMPVIIRTLDIGADKKVDYFNLPEEENPAMGYRAIRICLAEDSIFRTQLRAIFRASVFGKVAVMYPMIISVDEVHRIKKIVEEIKAELREEGISYCDIQQGIMIETPAAVMISDILAPEVDFFSIGTNDLSQYSLAIDRQNGKVSEFFDPHHPAIIRMIKMTVENAHRAGIWCGICGELAADTTLTQTFIEMGIDELSVSPSNVLKIRKAIIGS